MQLHQGPQPGPSFIPVDQRSAFPALACPKTRQPLVRTGDLLVTPDRAYSYPIVREIPRFVSSDSYVRSFSFEWNVHKHTQLDSYRHDSSSEEMLRQKTGLTPADVCGQLVLDAGVEAASVTFGTQPNVCVCQADIAALPFRPSTFDYIISIGVLHHTPDTRLYFSCLPPLLKPGGELAIWVYPKEGHYLVRSKWIPFTSRIRKEWFYSFCKLFVPFASKHRQTPWIRQLMELFPFSQQGLGMENDILDTFDGYSPQFHGIHSTDEVMTWFRQEGLADIRPLPWLTAVRGRRAA